MEFIEIVMLSYYRLIYGFVDLYIYIRYVFIYFCFDIISNGIVFSIIVFY